MTTIKLSRRSANYSKAELNCLVKYLEENPELVSVKLGGKYQTADDFRLAWEELADKISAVGGMYALSKANTEFTTLDTIVHILKQRNCFSSISCLFDEF